MSIIINICKNLVCLPSKNMKNLIPVNETEDENYFIVISVVRYSLHNSDVSAWFKNVK